MGLVLSTTSLVVVVDVLGGRGSMVVANFLLLRSCSSLDDAPNRVEMLLLLLSVLLVARGALLRGAHAPVRLNSDRRLVTLIATRVGGEQARLRLALFATIVELVVFVRRSR